MKCERLEAHAVMTGRICEGTRLPASYFKLSQPQYSGLGAGDPPLGMNIERESNVLTREDVTLSP